MADVYLPGIERAFRQLKKPRNKQFDATSVALASVIFASFFMYAAGSMVLSIPVIGFNATADVNVATAPVVNSTRAHRRLLHRVEGVMRSNCAVKGDVVFGSQVLVNGKPYMHRVVHLCDNKTTLRNPAVAFAGAEIIQCIDEHIGKKSVKSRPYPLGVDASGVGYNYSTRQDVCIISTILDMLNGTW